MSLVSRRILLLAACLLLALNYPWLAMFSKQTLLFGLPLLHVYLFVMWLVIILTVRYLLAGEDGELRDGAPENHSAAETDDVTK